MLEDLFDIDQTSIEDGFMLDLIRKHKALFSAIFVVAAAGLVISMFGSGIRANMGGASGAGAVVASIEDEEINLRQLYQSYQDQLSQMEQMFADKGGGSAQQREFMEKYIRSQVTPQSVLRTLLQERFKVKTARDLGFRASKRSVQSLIQDIPNFQRNGRFDPLLYRELVKEPGHFEKAYRDQADFTTFARSFQSGLAIQSPEEISLETKLKGKRVLEALRLNPANFPKPTAVTPGEVRDFTLSPESLTKLQSYYDRHLKDYQSEESIKASHILVRDTEGGLAKITEIQNEIKSGKLSFEDAAKKYSSDKSNAPKGGDLGYFGRNMMDPEFEKAAFALAKTGDVSSPVKSQFGFHLILLRDRKPGTKKTLDEVKSEIASKALLEEKKMAAAKAFIGRFSKQPPSESELKSLALKFEKLPEWSPLEDNLGFLGNVSSHISDLLSLNEANRYTKRAIPVADDLVIVKWISNKDASANEVASGSDKANEAFSFYLQRRFESLEKSKKIFRSQKILAQMAAQTAGSR
jgi:parvulin-like peptidyl-prolyl isomerase